MRWPITRERCARRVAHLLYPIRNTWYPCEHSWTVAGQPRACRWYSLPTRPLPRELNRTGNLGDFISWEDGVYGTSKSVFPGGARACRPDGRGAPGEAHASEWAVRQSVAPKLGCTAETLRKWVRPAQRDAGHRPGLTTSERER